MSEVEFEVKYEQVDYDEFHRPVAYLSIRGVTKEEALTCLRSMITTLENHDNVANPIG